MSHPGATGARDLAQALPGPARETLRHLLTCRTCRRRAVASFSTLAPVGVRRRPTRRVDSPLDLTLGEAEAAQVRRVLERHDPGGELLLSELLAVPLAEAARRIEQEERFRSWGLGWRLAFAGAETAAQAPEAAARLAHLALAVAGRLVGEVVPATIRGELSVRAWSSLATARRLAGRTEEAERALAAAAFELSELGDSAERAAWCRALGLLRLDQERPEEALALLARASGLFAEVGEEREAAATGVETAWTLLAEGQPERAIEVLSGALAGLDPAAQPGAAVRAWQGLASAHAELRELVEARRALREAHLLLLSMDEAPAGRARLLWREGCLAAELGEAAEAEAALAAASEELARSGSPYEAVLAGFDLARLFAEEGRAMDLDLLTAELGRWSAGFSPEPLAAVASFRHATAQGTATVQQIDRIVRFLRRAQNDHALRFAESPDDTATQDLGPPDRAGNRQP